MFVAILRRNIWFQLILNLIQQFRSEHYPCIVDLITGDIVPRFLEKRLSVGACALLSHSSSNQPPSNPSTADCNESALKEFALSPPEQRQYPLMKRLTARTEHWDDRHCGHYQKYFLYLPPITAGGSCGSP